MGPKGWGPEGWRPKISRFCPSPVPNFGLFFSLWVSSRGIAAAVQCQLHCARWASLGPFCVSPGGSKAAGVSHNEDPRDRIERNLGLEREKRSEILGGPAEGCVDGRVGGGEGVRRMWGLGEEVQFKPQWIKPNPLLVQTGV